MADTGGPNQHVEFTRLLIDLSSRMIDLDPSQTDSWIQHALGRIGEAIGAERVQVFVFRADGQTADNTHEWCADSRLSHKSRMQGICLPRTVPWLFSQLQTSEAVHVPRIDDLPFEARAERDAFSREQVKSLAVAPMLARGVKLGFLSIEAVRAARVWSEHDISLLRIAAQLLMSVLERSRIQRELAQSEERYRGLVENTGDWVWETDTCGVYSYSSPAVHELTGLTPEEVVGRTAFELMPPDEAERVRPIFAGIVERRLPIRQLENRLLRRDGSEIIVETSGRPFVDEHGRLAGYRGIDRDITERKRIQRDHQKLEMRMYELQRLESLGLLAGGVAHDFNNLLTAILGQASLARVAAQRDDRVVRSLAMIEEAARRAAELTRQLLAYSGRGTFVRSRVSLSSLVREMKPLVDSSVPRKGVLDWQLNSDSAEIEGDPSQLRQIIMNLVINASDAVVDKRDGAVMITTGLTRLEPSALLCDFFPPEAAGSTVAYIEVTDNGPGMSQEVQIRAFDPFFTTKHPGRGLGLPAVLGIVRALQGGLVLRSSPGNGASFRVLLPLAQPLEHNMNPKTPSEADEAAHPGRVLVIDDDDLVRHVACSMLEERGMKVVEAESGAKGLEEFGHDPKAIDLVVLDMTMPGLDGPEVAARLRAIQPDVRVLLVSGYPPEDTARRLGKNRADGYLQKPFSLDELVDAVTKLIEHPS